MEGQNKWLAGILRGVKPTFEEVYVPSEQGFAGAPKEIEKELFHSAHENVLFGRHAVFSHAQLGRVGKCPEPYTRQEVLNREFADILQELVIPQAMRRQTVTRLQAKYCGSTPTTISRISAAFDSCFCRM